MKRSQQYRHRPYLIIDDNNLEIVKNFIYLGLVVTPSNDINNEMRSIQIAIGTYSGPKIKVELKNKIQNRPE